MTTKELLADGWREFSWNGGRIMEYWKPLGVPDYFDFRVGVRFGKREEPTVYIWSSIGGMRFPSIDTIKKLNALYELLVCPSNPAR
jgi:hypothetical protein